MEDKTKKRKHDDQGGRHVDAAIPWTEVFKFLGGNDAANALAASKKNSPWKTLDEMAPVLQSRLLATEAGNDLFERFHERDDARLPKLLYCAENECYLRCDGVYHCPVPGDGLNMHLIFFTDGHYLALRFNADLDGIINSPQQDKDMAWYLTWLTELFPHHSLSMTRGEYESKLSTISTTDSAESGRNGKLMNVTTKRGKRRSSSPIVHGGHIQNGVLSLDTTMCSTIFCDRFEPPADAEQFQFQFSQHQVGRNSIVLSSVKL